jgi:hypothetical protein
MASLSPALPLRVGHCAQQTVTVVVVSGVTLPWGVAVPVGLQVPEGVPVTVLSSHATEVPLAGLHVPVGEIGVPPSEQSEACVLNQVALPWSWHDFAVGGSHVHVPSPQLRPSCQRV